MRVGTPGFVGARLAEARQARGLNGTELADLIGVSPQSVSQYEHEKQRPSPDMLGPFTTNSVTFARRPNLVIVSRFRE